MSAWRFVAYDDGGHDVRDVGGDATLWTLHSDVYATCTTRSCKLTQSAVSRASILEALVFWFERHLDAKAFYTPD